MMITYTYCFACTCTTRTYSNRSHELLFDTEAGRRTARSDRRLKWSDNYCSLLSVMIAAAMLWLTPTRMLDTQT